MKTNINNKKINKIDQFVMWLKRVLGPYLHLPKEVYVIFISRIVNAMGALVGTVMGFILVDKVGYDKEVAGTILTTAGLVLIVPPLIGGKLADMFGRKKIIIIFDILGITSYIICGFLNPDVYLVVFMLLAGIFYSAAGPAHESLLADISNSENRKQVFALSYMGWNIGYAIGAALAGLLYHNYLWLIFIGDALTTLVSLTLIILFIKGVHKKHQDEESDQEKSEAGSIFGVLLRRPKLIMFALIIMGFNFVYSQWGFLLQMNVLESYDSKLGSKYYGLMGSANGVIVMAFTAVISLLFIKTRNFKLIVSGGLFYAVGFGLLGVYKDLFIYKMGIPFFEQDIFYFFACVFIFTIGEILLTISVGPYIFNHTPSSHRGRMSAALGLVMGAGWIFGPMVSGFTLKEIGIYHTWKIIGLIAIVSSLLMYILGKFDKPIVEKEEMTLVTE